MGLFRKLKLGKTDRLKQGKLHVIKDASWDYTDEPKMAYSVGAPSWEESKSDEPKMVYSVGEPSMFDEPVKPAKRGLFRRKKVEPEEPVALYSVAAEDPFERESRAAKAARAHAVRSSNELEDMFKDEPALGRTANGISGWKK